MRLIGYTRVRNEALILKETLDHWGQLCDAIFVFDDASTDHTAEIAENHYKVGPSRMIRNDKWEPGVGQNGRQRRAIFTKAAYAVRATEEDWFVCFDADERLLMGDSRGFIEWCSEKSYSGITCKLFDFYITSQDVQREYDGKLSNLRDWCGPEYREQLFFFRWTPEVKYKSAVAREPNGVDLKGLISSGYVLHYGKAISVSEWEATCRYYSEHFPEPFKSKWYERKGKAIHTKSDFGRPLVRWSDIWEGKFKNIGPCLYAYKG